MRSTSHSPLQRSEVWRTEASTNSSSAGVSGRSCSDIQACRQKAAVSLSSMAMLVPVSSADW